LSRIVLRAAHSAPSTFIAELKRSAKNMKTVKFLPWIGDQYTSGLDGVKTLVLGESHYQWDCGTDINNWRSITQELVQEQIEGHYTKAFWTKIAISFIGHKPTLEEKRAFWSSIAFYNYVQESAGDGPRIAPPAGSWASSQEAFIEVLNYLKPEFILILGDRLTANLSHFLIERDVDINESKRNATYRISIQNSSKCIAYPIMHPSRGFNGREWNSHILKAMKI